MPDIAATLATANQALRSCTDSHDLEAQLLLAAVLDCDRTHLIAHAEDRLTSTQLEQLQNLLARRCGGDALAFILGWY
jgi:release factor glutamine methyltransferase